MNQKWWGLTAVACGTFMATLDASIVNIALPTLTSAFGVELTSAKWVVLSYLVLITCLLLPVGRIADLYGRRRIFTFGFLVFSIGSAFCALSQTMAGLVFSRTIQGIGAAMLMANGPAIVTSIFPSTERGKALGTLGMVVSMGLLTGPSLGGVLITHWGWASIFWINVPIGLLGILLVRKTLPQDPANSFSSFDWKGAILQFFALLSFLLFVEAPLIAIGEDRVIQPSRILLAVLTISLFWLLIRTEKKALHPVLDLNLFRIQLFWTANLASFLNFAATASLTVLMPFFMEDILAYTPAKAGLFMTAIPLTIFFIAPLSGRLSDRLGSRELTSLGAALATLNFLVMAGLFGLGLHSHMTPVSVILLLSLSGFATGLFQSPNNSAIMGVVPRDKLSVAAATSATVRNLGLIVGTGAASSLFAWRSAVTHDYVHSIHFVFVVSSLVATLAFLASMLRRPPNTQGTTHD